MPDRLSINETLPAGGDMTSPNGQHRASMQTDGNFVIYRRDGTPKWATGTDGRAIGDIVMQDDGNLVMYDANGPVWASGTDQHPGVSSGLAGRRKSGDLCARWHAAMGDGHQYHDDAGGGVSALDQRVPVSERL